MAGTDPVINYYLGKLPEMLLSFCNGKTSEHENERPLGGVFYAAFHSRF